MRRAAILCAAICLSAAGAGAAAAEDAPAGCDDGAQTQTDLNACAGAAYQDADDRLNGVYKHASLVAHQWGGEAQALLLAAQRAWIGYRDAACNAEAERVSGGSMAPMVQAMCLERLTKARTEEIRALYLTN